MFRLIIYAIGAAALLWIASTVWNTGAAMGILPPLNIILGAANNTRVVGVLLGLLFLLFVAPRLFRAFAGLLALPLRIGAWVWDRAVRLFLHAPISRLPNHIRPAGVDGWLARRTAHASNELLRGDRRAYAEHNWSKDKYPTLYQDIPADVRRSVVWDGRVLGGYSVTWLAWRHVSAEVVAGLTRAGMKVGLRAAAVTALLGVLWVLASVLFGEAQFPDDVGYPSWSEGVAIMPRVCWYVLAVLDFIVYAASSLGLVVIGAVLLAPAFAFFATWRGVHQWWAQASEALATPTRDSLVVYKHKADIREAEYTAYVRQVDRAIQLQAEGQPIIAVGKAMGVLRARGDMEAPAQGQAVCLDGDSIRQHTLILGGTGAGKTRLAVRPLFDRIMGASWGKGHRIGAYVTDGKGTLWMDLQKSTALKGRKDVVVVGTGTGQAAMDPLRGMSPLEVATTLKAVSGQVAGTPTDAFWPESASLLILHAATIAQVLNEDEETVTSPAWENAHPWSLVGLAALATSEAAQQAALSRIETLGELVTEDVEAAKAAKDAGTPVPALKVDAVVAKLMQSDAVNASTEWLRDVWAKMAKETQSGIIANVNIILGKLTGAGELRDRFCTGYAPDGVQVVDIDHALNGGIIMVAVGETEWGMVGKVVSVWLKTRLYIGARKRLQANPAACRSTSCALFADEWQMLATTGPDSDASFWNVARETGVFLVAATQSLAALKQVLGDEATANLVNLLRTKIVLKTEEVSTLDYCIKLAGESLRGVVTEDAFYETQGQRELERPDKAPAPDLGERVKVGRLLPTYPRMSTTSTRPIAVLDSRFFHRNSVVAPKGGGDGSGSLGAMQAAYWRQEDKERETRGAGLQYRPKLSTDELLLGSGLAFAIVQRAGCDRSDIIDLYANA